jgi:hypothetical protein
MFRTHTVDQVAEVGDVQTVSRRFPASSLVGALVGAALLIVGIVVLLRGDLTGSVREPVVSVLGRDHTPLLGLGEIAIGALLLIAAFAGSRTVTMFFAAALMIFGVVVLVQHASLQDDLGVESAHGWWALALGGLVLLAALLSNDDIVQRRRVTTVDPAVPVDQVPVQPVQPATTADPLADRRP